MDQLLHFCPWSHPRSIQVHTGFSHDTGDGGQHQQCHHSHLQIVIHILHSPYTSVKTNNKHHGVMASPDLSWPKTSCYHTQTSVMQARHNHKYPHISHL